MSLFNVQAQFYFDISGKQFRAHWELFCCAGDDGGRGGERSGVGDLDLCHFRYYVMCKI